MRLLLLFFVLIGSTLHAQKVAYFDADWNPTTKENAKFYSEVTITEKGMALVNDFHITGEKQMTGSYQTSDQKIREGNFVYYHKNGKISSKGKFEDNERVGLWQWYHPSGNISERGVFSSKGKEEKKWSGFHDNGQKDYEGLYKNGKKVGVWIYYHPNGVVSAKETWSANKITTTEYFNILGADCTERCGDHPVEYRGGADALFKYVREKNIYPEAANSLDPKPSGTVWVRFKITETGAIEDVSVREGVHWSLDAAAVKLVEEMPDWLPAKQHNRAISGYTELPFHYKQEKD